MCVHSSHYLSLFLSLPCPPKVLAALMWTVPGACGHVIPYFYCAFLTLLLADRAFRDDTKCASKYGAHWDKYCEKVSFKIIPGVV